MEEDFEMPDMTEEDFKSSLAIKSNSNDKPVLENAASSSAHPSVSEINPVYNSRDPAGAQTSSFAAAFGNLKKSEFYNSTKQEFAKPDIPTTRQQSSNLPKDPSSIVRIPIAPGAHRISRSGPLLVSPRQRGNPLLKSINSVPWQYQEDILPDYIMGDTTCALFLSLRYHNLNPDYIQDRLKLLGNNFKLRVLLVQVDLADPAHAITHLNRLAFLGNLTLMLAGSADEAGRIIETYKMFENKPPEMIMEREEDDEHIKIQSALTTVRAVNKTDAAALVKSFGSLEYILQASASNLELCPGFGTHKAQQLHKILHQPFLKNS